MKRGTFFQFTAPSIIIMALLMVVPLVMAIWLGMQFMTFNNITAPQFVGLRNYIDVLSDPRFWQSFRFTILFAVIVIPSQMLIGFTMALLLDQVKGLTRGIYLAIFLLPFIIVPIVGTIMFKQLFEASGLITYLISAPARHKISLYRDVRQDPDHYPRYLVCDPVCHCGLFGRVADFVSRSLTSSVDRWGDALAKNSPHYHPPCEIIDPFSSSVPDHGYVPRL